MSDEYRDSLDFLYGRLNYERVGMPKIPTELRLGRVRRLLRSWGTRRTGCGSSTSPGTKGKGSTAAMLAAALSAAGLRTGLFCSPHLHRLEERFTVDGRAATAEELVALTEAVRPAVADLDAHGPHHRHRGSTFFEITTAMGLLHFARRRAGAVVLEVGLGGRLDSTNVVRPVLSVLTSISFDHTRQLGTTLGAIAAEKAGILKRGRPAVSGVRGAEPRAAVQRVARQRRVRLRELDVDFRARYLPPPPPLVRPTAGRVEVRTWRSDWGPIELPLLGPHQAQNAAVALAGSTPWPSRASSVGPRGGRPGLRGAVLAGAGRGPGRLPVAGHRRRPQRRLGRGAGRDPADLLPPPRPAPWSSARPARRTSPASCASSCPCSTRSSPPAT
jgi:dihydrofolate synthase/folylpolyglutamate synthase